MNIQFYSKKLNLFLNYILVFYAATFLINSGLSRFLIYISILIWLLEGDFKEKFNEILKQKVLLYYLSVILCLLISLLFFSDSLSNGFWDDKYKTGYHYIFSKPIWYSLIMFIIYTSLKKEFLRYLIFAFVIQVLYMSLIKKGIDISFFISDSIEKRFFVNRIYFSIILVLSITSSFFLIFKFKSYILKLFFISLVVYFIYVLFTLPGRTGQFIFLINILLITIYLIKNYDIKKKVVIFLSVILFIISFFTFSYNYSKPFKKRINYLQTNIDRTYNYHNYKNSDAVRIMYNIVSFDILTNDFQNFIFGLGMGDSENEFRKFREKNYPQFSYLSEFSHIHNHFFEVWINGGLFALVFQLLIFFSILKLKVGLLEKVFLISTISVFFFYSFSGIIFARAKMIELYSLFIAMSILLEKYNSQKINNI